MSYQSVVLADSPYAYWRCGDPAGSLTDTSGNGFPGAAHGGIEYSQLPLIAEPFFGVWTVGSIPIAGGDRSIAFDGATGFFDQATMTPMHTGVVISVEAWVLPSSNPGGAPTFVANDDAASTNFGFFLGYAAGAYVFAVATNAGAQVASFTHTFDTAHTHYLAGTFDGRYATLYLDGSSVATADAGSVTTTRGGNFNTTVGMNPQTSAGFWPGVIDEVAVYDSALSAARVAAHYAAGI